MDAFLNFFSDTAGSKDNFRLEEGQSKSAGGNESEMSDGTVNSLPSPEKGEDQSKTATITFSAPDDAKGCIRVDSLKQYIKN